jgi:hypothetical protein
MTATGSIIPRGTTTDRAALSAVLTESTALFLNTTTQTLQITTDAGSNWADMDDSSAEDLQGAYDSGNGGIDVSSSKPFFLQSVNSGIPPTMAMRQLVTAGAGNILSNIDAIGKNTSGTNITYFQLENKSKVVTAGNESSQITLKAMSKGVVTSIAAYHGDAASSNGVLNVNTTVNMLGFDLNNIGNIESGQTGISVSSQTGMTSPTILFQSFQKINNIVNITFSFTFTATATSSSLTVNVPFTANNFSSVNQATGSGNVAKNATSNVWEGKTAFIESVNGAQTVKATMNTVDNTSLYFAQITASYYII